MPSRGLDILLQLDSLVAQMVKNLPGVQETQVRSLEKRIATQSRILPWAEETGKLQSIHGVTKSQT